MLRSVESDGPSAGTDLAPTYSELNLEGVGLPVDVKGRELMVEGWVGC
jgi:hypothetical protein